MLTSEKPPPRALSAQRKSVRRSPPVVHYEADGCVMATWENLSVVIWGTQGTVAHAEIFDRISADLVKAHPQGVSSIHIITNNAPVPGGAAREEFAKLTNRYAANVACVGVVLDGVGFWASSQRCFLTSLLWLSQQPFKARCCSTILELVRWLPTPHEKRTLSSIAPAELDLALVNLRRRVGPRPKL